MRKDDNILIILKLCTLPSSPCRIQCQLILLLLCMCLQDMVLESLKMLDSSYHVGRYCCLGMGQMYLQDSNDLASKQGILYLRLLQAHCYIFQQGKGTGPVHLFPLDSSSLYDRADLKWEGLESLPDNNNLEGIVYIHLQLSALLPHHRYQLHILSVLLHLDSSNRDCTKLLVDQLECCLVDRHILHCKQCNL